MRTWHQGAAQGGRFESRHGTDDESTVRVVRGQSGVEISNGWQPQSGLNPKISSFSLAAVGAVLIANTMAELAAGFLSRKARESAPNTPTTILSLKDLAANTITGWRPAAPVT